MSLINKERIDKYNGIVFGLSSFIPEEIDRKELIKSIVYTDLSYDEKEILLDTVNVFNLFSFSDTDKIFFNYDVEEWNKIDKKQTEYTSSFNLDEKIYKKFNRIGLYILFRTNINYLLDRIKNN